MVSPVWPVAPATLITGSETLSCFSIPGASLRASWSAPPPGPQGTMNSIGRDGYFSCAHAPAAAASASTVPINRLYMTSSLGLASHAALVLLQQAHRLLQRVAP